jgi:hypothetical protein
MAAYACPIEVSGSMDNMMEAMPCHEIDHDKPVHCATHLGHDELALQHLDVPLALTLPTVIYIIPVSGVIDVSSRIRPEVRHLAGTDSTPPYLRTCRMRI